MKKVKRLFSNKVNRITALWVLFLIIAVATGLKLVALVLGLYFILWLKLTSALRGA